MCVKVDARRQRLRGEMLPRLLQNRLGPLLLELLQLAEHGLVGLDAEAAAEVGDHRHLELAQVGNVQDLKRGARCAAAIQAA